MLGSIKMLALLLCSVVYSRMYLRLFILRRDSEHAEYAPENWEVVLSGLSTSSSVYSISNTEAHKHQEKKRKWVGRIRRA